MRKRNDPTPPSKKSRVDLSVGGPLHAPLPARDDAFPRRLKAPKLAEGRHLRPAADETAAKPDRHHFKLWLECVTPPPPTSFSYDLGFKGNCCGCDPCPGMRSWTLLKGLSKGTSVLELCGSPAMGDSIELETVRTNGSHRDADLSEVRVSGRVQQLMIVRYCTWNWVFAVPCRT